jgi:histidyl-tRNA synthetase
MAKLQPVRGTRDIWGDDSLRFRQVVNGYSDLAERYGFQEIQTPIFEFTDVFKRTLGDSSDVVSKEMYTFDDRGGEEITLRPEYTAGIARAYISEGMQQLGTLKFYGHGPMFRYERPQKGRYRQFHQLDAEILGVSEPQADIEVITLGYQLLLELGIAEKTKLHINSLGDMASRKAYRDALVGYFGGVKDQLSKDSLERLDKNPLRILDSKNEGDRNLVEQAPKFSNYLNEDSVAFFEAVQAGLLALGIPFEIDETLVRGLDYYCHTVFEFITTDLGSQGAVIAGGRYDGLVELMGGPKTPGVGWAAGIERLGMLLDDVAEPHRPIALIPLGEDATILGSRISYHLRLAGERVDMGFCGNLKKRLQRANKLNAKVAVILGDEEIKKGVVIIRNLDDGEQEEVAFDKVLEMLVPER